MLRVSFGDVHYVAQGVAVAVKERDWRILRTTLWSIREHHRRGTWKPFSFHDYRTLRRRQRRRSSVRTPPG